MVLGRVEDRYLNSPLKPSEIRTMVVGMQVVRGPQEAPNQVGTIREDINTETGRMRH